MAFINMFISCPLTDQINKDQNIKPTIFVGQLSKRKCSGGGGGGFHFKNKMHPPWCETGSKSYPLVFLLVILLLEVRDCGGYSDFGSGLDRQKLTSKYSS